MQKKTRAILQVIFSLKKNNEALIAHAIKTDDQDYLPMHELDYWIKLCEAELKLNNVKADDIKEVVAVNVIVRLNDYLEMKERKEV